MKTTVPQWLAQGLVTLFVVAASLAAYDRWVLRPALVIGVVDVAEVYRAKEAEFTQILTKALSQPARRKTARRRSSWPGPSPSACRSPSMSCRGNATAW
jgi:hypothetical protein